MPVPFTLHAPGQRAAPLYTLANLLGCNRLRIAYLTSLHLPCPRRRSPLSQLDDTGYLLAVTTVTRQRARGILPNQTVEAASTSHDDTPSRIHR